ncbi:MAG: multicopper oxidase domain-containing protein [Acidobacteria bacterium]|nr:multicopper oxidase domain-containing protein [Acidobacteriota bacterium]
MRTSGGVARNLILLIAGLLMAVPAGADTVTLLPTKDNTLYEPIAQDGFQDRSDGAGPTMFAGKVKDADADPGPGTRPAVRRAVLAFNIAANIPASATINSVQLTLYVDKVKLTTGFNVSLHRLLSDWGEGTSNTGNSQQGRGEPPTPGDATWHHTFYPDQFWSIPGGDYSLTASATRTVGNTGFYTWGSTSGLVADVQFWLNNPSQTFGWIVVGTETTTETTKRFGTRENTGQTGGVSWKPALVINYTPQMISGACCQGATCSVQTPAACLALPGAYQGDGTSCSPNPCVVATGACCASNGTCTEVSQSECTGSGGTYQGDGSACAGTYCPILLTPYLDPLPIPPVATPVIGSPGGAATYNITTREFEQHLHSQLPPTRVWGYHDGVGPLHTPGPVIVARTGEPVTVNWINDIRDLANGVPRRDSHYLEVDVQKDGAGDVCIMGAEARAKTVAHLHGGHVPASFDGYPEDTYLPGDPPVPYTYPNNQQASYLWFHDHALGITRLNVYMGLAGAYLMRDAVEDAINLPRGQYEVPLVIQDRKFNPDGSLSYPGTWVDHFFGDKVIVNGKVWPYLDVRRGKYLFRLLNGSTSRVYTLSLIPPSGTLTFSVIGNEGGLLEAPAHGVGSLTIGPGERYDVVVDFAGFANGDEILLNNSAGAPFPNGPVDVARMMKFRVASQAGDTDPVPAALRPIQRIDPAEAVGTRDFRLKQSGTDGCGRSMWEINGLHWNDITEYPQLGTTEIWRFINDSGVSHPMHMHLVMFQVLDRDGFTNGAGGTIIPNGTPQAPPAEESGWKDTAMVGPNQILRVIARFEDYKGKYAYHCHILEHEDHEMMRQFQTIQCGDGEIDATEGCDDGIANGTPGSCCTSACTVVADGTACSDDNICTEGDRCLAGACAPGAAVAPPGEVPNDTFAADGMTLTWDAIPGAPAGTVFDVARGLAAELPVGAGASETCLAPGIPAQTASDAASPGAGQVFWYLVRGRHACGTGTYGYAASNGVPTAERITLTCP